MASCFTQSLKIACYRNRTLEDSLVTLFSQLQILADELASKPIVSKRDIT